LEREFQDKNISLEISGEEAGDKKVRRDYFVLSLE
jgi:hypothetical protein